MTTVFELARQLKAPGVQTAATFNPARLSPRLRKMTKDSILSGYYKGGWSSQAKQLRTLAFNLVGEKPAFHVLQDSNYIKLNSDRPTPDNTKSVIIGLLEADCTLRKMSYTESTNRYQPKRDEFYKEADRWHDQNIEALHKEDGRSNYMIVREPKLKVQIAMAFLNDRLDDEIDAAKRIASVFDDDKEWTIPLNFNF